MPLSYRDLTQPAAEPVTLDQVKEQLVLDSDYTADDILLLTYIVAARQLVEKLTNRAIFERSTQLTLDHFPCPRYSSTINPNDRTNYGIIFSGMIIRLPRPACTSVESITYQAQDGTVLTLDPSQYRVDLNSEPARITPLPGGCWPFATFYIPGTVQVTYTAGSYGDGSDPTLCPQTIVMAMLLIIGHWYQNREAVSATNMYQVPLAVETLLAGEMFDSVDLTSCGN
jgi:hypothetical protein